MLTAFVSALSIFAWCWITLGFIRYVPFQVLINLAGLFVFTSLLNLFYSDTMDQPLFGPGVLIVLIMSSIVNIGASLFYGYIDKRKEKTNEEESS